ncbi:MAG: hypothetical protein M5U26_28215 [Planctomycetota bacterium]|nr:hypothetical protein [Planctomycetota bacterium]
MIGCRHCKRSCQTSIQEELEDCPECKPDRWRVFNVRPGARMPHNVEQAVRQAPFRVFGRCFLTPRGNIVPLHLLREYKLTRVLRAVPGPLNHKTAEAGGEGS